MHAEIYEKILDGNIKLLLKHMIQMRTGDADTVCNIRYADSLHIHFINVINCEVYISIIAKTGLHMTVLLGMRGMMVGKDGKQFKQNGLTVKIVGKARVSMCK